MKVTSPRRRRRVLAVLAVTGAAIAGLTACEPASAELNSSAVAVTTDRTATRAMERLGYKVSWFSCTARLGGTGESGATAPAGYATVDCEGETKSGQPITLKGRVTDERSGTCIRGDLRTRINDKLAFTATYLGDCDSQPSGTPRPSGPANRPGDEPRATVTVTETVTVTAEPTRQ
ncbi:hypothetical protein [Streptomyces albipurpureus]|uniref:Lipoprotein n=1 Tax=Streptomyces albipurpureus TaxID=2897419 RepID=A0ABT0UJ79_9ACTN|nr:hypothetical protein [Streptomyces sp. CWNU-1]MCM2388500.1 hypothetical protein [Streptomyces sp. CWNU-1]